MRAIVTCGPSYEPIDEVRRLTNLSTGELGVVLSRRLAARGFEVVCLKGAGAVAPGPAAPVRVVRFTTNASLFEALSEIPRRDQVRGVFHCAALCDFQVRALRSARTGAAAKIPSRGGALRLILEPAPKVLPRLRELFPRARIVGWKYELDGSRTEALEKAFAQIQRADTDACVINGRAFGPGFGVCEKPKRLTEFADKRQLASYLAEWLERLIRDRRACG